MPRNDSWATWSLQKSLVAIAFGVSLVAWIAGGAVIWRVAQEHAESLHDVALQHTAELLLGLSGHEIEELGASTPLETRIANGKADGATTLGDNYRYQLWSHDGGLLLSNFGIASASAMARMNRPGYSWLTMDGERWRVYSLVSEALRQELHIAEREASRSWFTNAIDWKFGALIPLSLLAVVFPAVLLVRRVMRPLRQLHEQLEARSAANLTHLSVVGAPSEVAPIVSAMNALFRRMNEAMERESSFTSLAAHELRTPLASLRLLAQAVASTDDPAIRAQSIRDLITSADRCSHLQDQLLTLARLDATHESGLGGSQSHRDRDGCRGGTGAVGQVTRHQDLEPNRRSGHEVSPVWRPNLASKSAEQCGQLHARRWPSGAAGGFKRGGLDRDCRRFGGRHSAIRTGANVREIRAHAT